MSCPDLGLTDECLRLSRSADEEIILKFPSSHDFTGYTGEFVCRANESSFSAFLTVTNTATSNGSVMTFLENVPTLLLKRADIRTLPSNPEDADLPYVGVCEWIATDPDGLTSRLFIKPLIVEPGVAR